MARRVSCPMCGVNGTIAPCDNKVFQGRGVFEGKSVAKCKKCGCGLFFGPFSGTYFGKPKLIPEELWFWLDDMVQYFVNYVKDHNTIGFLVYDEGEFEYAEAYASLGLTRYYNKNLSDQFVYAVEAYTALGDKYCFNKQFEIAIKHFTKAIQLDPNYAIAYNRRGNAYYKKGQYDKAIEENNEAIELEPNYAVAYNDRGLSYYEKRQYDRAIEDFSKAIKLEPDYAEAYNNRSLAYDRKGQHGIAIEDYNKAIELGRGK